MWGRVSQFRKCGVTLDRFSKIEAASLSIVEWTMSELNEMSVFRCCLWFKSVLGFISESPVDLQVKLSSMYFVYDCWNIWNYCSARMSLSMEVGTVRLNNWETLILVCWRKAEWYNTFFWLKKKLSITLFDTEAYVVSSPLCIGFLLLWSACMCSHQQFVCIKSGSNFWVIGCEAFESLWLYVAWEFLGPFTGHNDLQSIDLCAVQWFRR